MKIKNLGVAIALVALLSLEVRARAADLFFTNAIGGDFLGSLNWSPNVVPGAADNANFTNPIFPTITWSASRTNNNAIIDGTSGGFQALIGANFWRGTNSFVMGQSAGRAGTVLHVSGELRVTNSAGTAQLIIGKNGKGAYVLNSPTATVSADQL